jgi:hypothetical protein
MYYLNRVFLIKMAFFVSAVVFHYAVHRKAVSSETLPSNGKLVAWASLVLWAGVVFGGIFIGLQVKRKFDPTNFFRMNQNIAP